MVDKQEPDFEILPTLGIKCRLYADGSAVLEQYDPFLDDGPNFVQINAQQLDTVIGWLTQFRSELEAS